MSTSVPRPVSVDLAALTRDFAAVMRARAPYRPPTPTERDDATGALLAIAEGRIPATATSTLGRLGFTVGEQVDSATGRPSALVVNERGTDRAWGLYAIDLSRPVQAAVEVPHPNADVHTEEIGAEVYGQAPGSILLVAGAHRRAGNGHADVAHQDDSLFNALATALAERGVPQLQLHGFRDDALAGTDLIISPGAGRPTPLVRSAATRLSEAGFALCRAWEQKCGDLAGTRNVQGKTAANLGTAFVHLEINRRVRDGSGERSAVARALAAAM